MTEQIGNVPRDCVKYTTGTTVANPVGDGEARLPGIAKNSATTAFLSVVPTVARSVGDGETRPFEFAKDSATIAVPVVVPTVAEPVGDGKARPPEFQKHSTTTESNVAVSSGEAGPSWPRAKSTPSARVTAAARPAGEARPPGIAKQSATTDSEIAVSARLRAISWFPSRVGGPLPWLLLHFHTHSHLLIRCSHFSSTSFVLIWGSCQMLHSSDLAVLCQTIWSLSILDRIASWTNYGGTVHSKIVLGDSTPQNSWFPE